MTWELGLTQATALVALILFVDGRFRIDQVALLVPGLLLLGGVISADQAVAGFGDPATVTVAEFPIRLFRGGCGR